MTISNGGNEQNRVTLYMTKFILSLIIIFIVAITIVAVIGIRTWLLLNSIPKV